MLPLFPLPNVVLFPGAMLPLHVFEPRYRAMVSDALEGDRRIGIVLLKPGWDADYDGRPPIFPIGCSGVIVHDARLADGRFNIILRGIERVRILCEDESRPYRLAETVPAHDAPLDEADRAALIELRVRVATLLGEAYRGPLPSMPDVDLVHTLAQSLGFDAIEKQALLEAPGLRQRAASLVDLIEMRQFVERLPGGSDVAH